MLCKLLYHRDMTLTGIQRPSQDDGTPVDIHVRPGVSKSAILQADPNSYINLISLNLVNNVLEQGFHPWGPGQVMFRGQMIDVQGYIDITWSFEGTHRTYCTQFFVPSGHGYCFDIVLGASSAREYGIRR